MTTESDSSWHGHPDRKHLLVQKIQALEATLDALRLERQQQFNQTWWQRLTPDRLQFWFFPPHEFLKQEITLQLQIMSLRQQYAHDLIDDLPQLNPSHWRTLNPLERLRVALSVHQRYAQAFGMILTRIKLELSPLYIMDGSYQHNDGQDPVLRINDDELRHQTPAEMVNTIIHETRHALQHQAIDHAKHFDYIPTALIHLWETNLEAYIPYWKDTQAYFNQPVERDAWDAGNQAEDYLY